MHWDHTIDTFGLGIIVSVSLIYLLFKIRNYIKELETTLLNRIVQNEEKKYGLELEKLRVLSAIVDELAKGNRGKLNR